MTEQLHMTHEKEHSEWRGRNEEWFSPRSARFDMTCAAQNADLKRYAIVLPTETNFQVIGTYCSVIEGVCLLMMLAYPVQGQKRQQVENDSSPGTGFHAKGK